MILRLIYRTFKRQIHNLLIEDLLMNIPNKVGRPAIEIVSGKRESVVKWLYYEANAVARRLPTHFDNLERRNGILIMIQAFISALSSSGFPDEVKPPAPMQAPKKSEWEEGVKKFAGHVPKDVPVDN